jgi:hypothetical protein
MRRPTVSWSATIAAAAALACGGYTEQERVAPSAAGRCQMSLSAPELPAAAAQITAELSATRDCAWSAHTAAEWLQVEPVSGQGPATLTLTAAENPLGRNRTAALAINDQTFPVIQQAAPCSFEVTPATVTMIHQGGRVALQVSTREGCSWTTHSSQPWVRVVAGSGGESSGALELAVDSNTGAERSAVLTVATTLVVVNQNAGPNDRTECRFSLSPGSRRLPAAGGVGSFSVSTLAGCAWSAVPDRPWVAIVSSANAIGSENVSYRVEPNPSTVSRSATITAGTRRHVVYQEAAPRP